MNVICVDEDRLVTKCTGVVIVNEKANETVGESAGQNKKEEKAVVVPVQMRSYILGKSEDVPFKSLKELKEDYMETRKNSFEKIFQYML